MSIVDSQVHAYDAKGKQPCLSDPERAMLMGGACIKAHRRSLKP